MATAPQRPKIINTSPAIHRDTKTFVVYTSPKELNEKLMRFHSSIITNLNTYDEYSKILEKPAQLILLDVNELDVLKKVKSPDQYFKNVSVYVLTNSTIKILQKIFPNFREFAKNLVVLDNIHEHFTYLCPWNGTLLDGISILSIIHGNQIIQMNGLEQDQIKIVTRDSIQKFISITSPPEFWMFTQFYKPKEKIREMEINETLRLNTDCEFVDKIVIFLEKEEDRESIKRILAKKPRSALAKIRFVSLLHRLTYSDFFSYINSSEVPENTYVALTNADIYFDQTIGNIWSISMENRLLALVRYEHSDNGPMSARMFGPRPDSQDTWIFSAASIKQRNWTPQQLEKFNYQLGIPGCDNSFTTDMIREKFLTVNPAGTIRTYHYHSSQIRNYTQKDILWRPVYIYITPTSITELEQVHQFGNNITSISTNNLINIQSNNETRAQTYCTMLARPKKYVWNIGKNVISSKLRIYEVQNVISCSQGFLFDNFKLWVGDQDEAVISEYLRGANINQLNRTATVENFVSVPVISKKVFEEPGLFLLEYVMPLLLILGNLPKDNVYSYFWPEKFNELLKFIEFPVKAKIIPVIYDLNFYSAKCWAITPHSFKICRNAVNSFRTAWRLESVTENSNVITLVDNGKIFSSKNETFIGDLKSIIEKYGWELDIVIDGGGGNTFNQYCKLSQSGGMIFWNDGATAGTTWRSAWNLPKGAAFLEFQNEFILSGEAQEFAGACELDSRIFILQKADDTYLQGLVLKYVEEYLQANPKNSVETGAAEAEAGAAEAPAEASKADQVSLSLEV